MALDYLTQELMNNNCNERLIHKYNISPFSLRINHQRKALETFIYIMSDYTNKKKALNILTQKLMNNKKSHS